MDSESDTDSILSTLHPPLPFCLSTSRCIYSGWLTKAARGRNITGRIMGSTKLRWFELCVDGGGGEGREQYCIFYYKGKDHSTTSHSKPLGSIQLSAYDSIILSDTNPCLICLQLESDTETTSHLLKLVASDEEVAEQWVDAFQNAILSLNRLTTVVEGEDEDRVTSVKKTKSTVGSGILAEGAAGTGRGVRDGSCGKDVRSNSVTWSKKKDIRLDNEGEIIGTSNEGEVDRKGEVRKRDIVKGWIRGKERDVNVKAGAGGGGGYEEEGILEWGVISGNGGGASWAKAIMWCTQKEMELEEREEEGQEEEEQEDGGDGRGWGEV